MNIKIIKKFLFPNKKQRLISFTKSGYLYINSRVLRQTKGYKRQLQLAEQLSKELNLKG